MIKWVQLPCMITRAGDISPEKKLISSKVQPTAIWISKESIVSLCSYQHCAVLKKTTKKKHMGLPEPCMGSTLRRFSQPFTFNNSQLFSPGRMLNNDVSAFLRLQRHSPGSTRELKKPWTATSNPDRDLCCIPHLSLPLFFSHSSTVQMVKTCIKQISPTNRLFSILPLKFFDTIQHVLPCIWGGGTTFNLCIL